MTTGHSAFGPAPRSRLAALAVSLVIGGLVLACGGGGAPSPAGSQAAAGTPAPVASTAGSGGSTVDACSLVTTDEVQAKAGDTVSKTEHGSTSCTWWLGDDQTSWIKLVVWPNGKAMFDAAAAEGQAVSGLGDKAFSDGPSLVALKGDTMLQLGSEIVLSPADPAVFNRPLMELALGRL